MAVNVQDAELPPAIPRSDSLRRRYSFKLLSNVVTLAGNFVTQLLVPRALGPALYGDYSFLTNFFTQVTGFFDAGTSTGFYTRLSQRQQDRGLVRFYALIVGAVLAVVAGLAAVVFAARLQTLLWPGQTGRYIWMALGFSWLLWCHQVVGQMLDAFGLTVPGELMRMAQKLLGALVLVALFLAGVLSLASFFAYQYATLALLIGLWAVVLSRYGRSLLPTESLPEASLRRYGAEMYEFAAPLAVMGMANLIFGIADRWLLQWFAGSSQQGFFGLSVQIGAICFLFTSALVPIWMREMAIAHSRGDIGSMRRMFLRYVPLLYAVAAYFAVFVAWQGGRIATLFGGRAFAGAGAAVAIMALYPVHQTYGQLSGTVLLVTGQTKLYRNLAVITASVGVPATLWLLGPRRLGGLDLGATGLAIKMIAIQFIGVNLQLWFNARMLRLRFGALVGEQLASVALFGVAGWVAVAATSRIVGALVPNLLASGAIYTLLCTLAVVAFPRLCGFSRGELWREVRVLAVKLRPTGTAARGIVPPPPH